MAQRRFPIRQIEHRGTPLVAALVCSVYALTHLWWALVGDPVFFGTAVSADAAVRGESLFPGGWTPVVVAAAASIGSLVVLALAAARDWRPRPSVRWLIVGLCGLGGVGLVAYCMLVWIGLAMVLMVLFGQPMHAAEVGLLLVRATGTIGGGLALWVARSAYVRSRPTCDRCGGIHGRTAGGRHARAPWWGVAGAGVALAGLSARTVPQAADVLDAWTDGGVGFRLFVVLLLMSGTVLPVALAARWGRIWPRWVVPLAGRDVPRWLALGPAVFIGTGLTAYFGAGGITAMATGATPSDLKAILEIGGYTVWGIGLLIAATAYAQLTRTPCPGGARTVLLAARAHA